MRLSAAGLVLVTLFVLTPLAHADITYYVDNRSGVSSQDVVDGVHGLSAALPWKTTAFAMLNMRQPNTANGHTHLRIQGNHVSSISINPTNRPADGKEYWFYGDTTNPYNVKIDGSSATSLCSTYVNIRGIWFRDGISINGISGGSSTKLRDVPIHPDSAALTSPDFRLKHTKRRLFNSVRKCVLGDSSPAFSSTGVSVEASNVLVANSRIIGGNIGVNRSPGDGSLGRFRVVGVELNGLTAHWTVASVHKISAGISVDSNCPVGTTTGHCPNKTQFTDSLKIWFCNFRGQLCSGCDKHFVSLYHCHNLSLRGNHWYLSTQGQTGDERVFSIRDSMDNINIDRDTLIITDDPVGHDVKMLVGYNASRSGNGRSHWVVDSSYWQVPRIEWSTALSGTFTYTTFVAKTGLSFVDDTDKVDSLQTNTFNHCTIVGTSEPSTPLVSFNQLDKPASSTTTYGWPSTITNGNVLHFKNNLLFRAKSWGQQGTCYNTDPFPLITWGDCFNTSNPARDNSLRISTANNLYVTDDYIFTAGDLSQGWRAPTDTCSGPRRSSKPGTAGSYAFKAKADVSATGYAAAANSNYDSLGTHCNRADIQFEEWFDPNGAGTNFDRVWVTGELLDLNIPYTSFARGRGEGVSDVGAVAVRASPHITFESDTIITVVDNSSASYEATITIHNTGDADLNPTFSAEPLGQYFAVISLDQFPLAPGGTVVLPITIVDPSFALPVGQYYLDVVVTHGAGSAGTVGRRIRFNIERQQYSVD